VIKIKDYIFNENELLGIVYIKEENKLELISKDKYSEFIENATFEDIEWNYEDEQIRKCLDSIDREEELEEENKKLNELIVFNVQTSANLTKINNQLEDRINKVFEYLENTDLGILEFWKVKEILKGEDND